MLGDTLNMYIRNLDTKCFLLQSLSSGLIKLSHITDKPFCRVSINMKSVNLSLLFNYVKTMENSLTFLQKEDPKNVDSVAKLLSYHPKPFDCI